MSCLPCPKDPPNADGSYDFTTACYGHGDCIDGEYCRCAIPNPNPTLTLTLHLTLHLTLPLTLTLTRALTRALTLALTLTLTPNPNPNPSPSPNPNQVRPGVVPRGRLLQAIVPHLAGEG